MRFARRTAGSPCVVSQLGTQAAVVRTRLSPGSETAVMMSGALRGGSILSGKWSMIRIDAGLLLAAAFLGGCLGGPACVAQQARMGRTDLDGLYQPQAETSNPEPKEQVHRRKAATKPESDSKLTNWEEETARQNADDDRLRRTLKICRSCDAPR